MTKNETSAQKKVDDICRTADALAKRMGKTFVPDPAWRKAFLRQEEQYLRIKSAEEQTKQAV